MQLEHVRPLRIGIKRCVCERVLVPHRVEDRSELRAAGVPSSGASVQENRATSLWPSGVPTSVYRFPGNCARAPSINCAIPSRLRPSSWDRDSAHSRSRFGKAHAACCVILLVPQRDVIVSDRLRIGHRSPPLLDCDDIDGRRPTKRLPSFRLVQLEREHGDTSGHGGRSVGRLARTEAAEPARLGRRG